MQPDCFFCLYVVLGLFAHVLFYLFHASTLCERVKTLNTTDREVCFLNFKNFGFVLELSEYFAGKRKRRKVKRGIIFYKIHVGLHDIRTQISELATQS